jgi:hypothetical protein
MENLLLADKILTSALNKILPLFSEQKSDRVSELLRIQTTLLRALRDNSKGRFVPNFSFWTLIFLAGKSAAFGDQSIALAWNPSTDPNTVGYNIYYGGTSGVYTNSVHISNANAVVISGLMPGATYYSSATAVSASGAESSFSNEINFVVPQTSTNPPAWETNSQPATASLANVSLAAGQINFQVTGAPGGIYLVQATSDMINWTSVQTNTSPFTFQASATSGCQFYRAVYLAGN